jgi:hypothetical protein
MKQIFKIAGAVAILFLMSIAPYLSENLVPEAQAFRGRGAAFVVGAAVGSAGSAPAPAPAPAQVIVVQPAAPAPAAAPPPQAAPAPQPPAK